jgi:hypothetical protein
MARVSREAFSLHVTHRKPLFVDLANWDHYHSERRQIDLEYPLALDVLDPDAAAVKALREHARDALRAQMRTLISTGPASYLIAV